MRQIVKSFRVSGWIMKLLGQWRNFFIRVAKTQKLCPEEQIKENTFSKEKSLLFFFKIPGHFLSIPAETFAKSVESVTYVALEDFEGKYLKLCTIFQLWPRFQTSLDFFAKIRIFSRKNFSRFVKTAVRACRKNFSGFPSGTFCFFNRFLEFEQLFSRLLAKKLSRCVKKSIYVYRRKRLEN